MTSLRNTVMVYVTILLVAVGIVAAASAYLFVKHEVNSFQDNALEQIALTAGLTYRKDIEPHIDPELEDQIVVQIWSRSGASVYQSGPQVDIPFLKELGYFDLTAGGEQWRVFRAQDSEHALQISQRWSARDEVAANAAAGAAIPLVASVPIAWLLIGWAVNRVLRGLKALSTDIGERSANAAEPLDTRKLPLEIAPVVVAMNALIERMQGAIEKQRRFVADAAHELRTPLAALQIQADNLSNRELPAAAQPFVDSLRQGVKRASYLVSQLLEMARADSHPKEAIQTINLREQLQSVLEDFVALAGTKNVSLGFDARDDIAVISRPFDVNLIVSTLLDNALRYVSDNGKGDIALATTRVGDRTVVEISDNGCGIPDAALPMVFDRFFRAAPPGIGGTGLGLSIAKAAADRNGMTLSIRNRTDRQGVIASVTFPSVAAPA